MHPLLRFLPKTDVLLLKVVVVALSIAIGSLGTRAIAISDLNPLGLGIGMCFLALAIALWRLHPFALSIVKLLLGLSMALGIGGIFNPFFDMDYRADNRGQEPPWFHMISIAVPLVLAVLFIFWVLDKHKGEFGSPQPPPQ